MFISIYVEPIDTKIDFVIRPYCLGDKFLRLLSERYKVEINPLDLSASISRRILSYPISKDYVKECEPRAFNLSRIEKVQIKQAIENPTARPVRLVYSNGAQL